MLVHKGTELEKAGSVPAFDPTSDPEEWGVILELLRNELKTNNVCPSTTSGFSLMVTP